MNIKKEKIQKFVGFAVLVGVATFYVAVYVLNAPEASQDNEYMEIDEGARNDVEIIEKVDCSTISSPERRYDCYLDDESRRLMKWAIENERPDLCYEIDHVFIPNDAEPEMWQGDIGQVLTDQDAIEACQEYVEAGRVPSGR